MEYTRILQYIVQKQSIFCYLVYSKDIYWFMSHFPTFQLKINILASLLYFLGLIKTDLPNSCLTFLPSYSRPPSRYCHPSALYLYQIEYFYLTYISDNQYILYIVLPSFMLSNIRSWYFMPFRHFAFPSGILLKFLLPLKNNPILIKLYPNCNPSSSTYLSISFHPFWLPFYHFISSFNPYLYKPRTASSADTA